MHTKSYGWFLHSNEINILTRGEKPLLLNLGQKAFFIKNIAYRENKIVTGTMGAERDKGYNKTPPIVI